MRRYPQAIQMNDVPEKWKRTESRQIADCAVFRVREDRSVSGDRSGRFFVIENPDWVNVIALTADREVVLIQQFRHGVEALTVEIPGGMVDKGEDPAEAARRELLEETGYTASSLVKLGESSPNPALQSNRMHHFLAIGAAKTAVPEFDDHESVVSRTVPIETAERMILDGEIDHALVIAAFHFLRLRGGGQIE